MDVVEQDWPTLEDDGVLIAWKIDKRGAGVAATVSGHDWQGRVVGIRTYDGQWEVSGQVTWRPGGK